MSKWEYRQIKELGYVITGKTPPTNNLLYYGEKFPFATPSDLTFETYRLKRVERKLSEEAHKKYIKQFLPTHAIMYTSIASIGKIGIASEETLTNQQINSVIANSNNNYYFLYCSLKMATPYFQAISGGVATPIVNKTTFENTKLFVPDLPTQERIADILSAYDDLIEANNRRIELLEQAAQELYKEWFVLFRFPGHEKAKFENGLPEGWTVKKIGDMFQITSSKRVYLADYVENGIPFYRSKEVIQLSQGQAITEPLYISNAVFQSFKNKFGAPEENDILITSVGTIGISYLVDGHQFYFKDGNLTWIKSSSDKMLSLLLFQWLNSQWGKQQLHQSTIGTSQSALTIENLKKVKLIVPDKKLVEDYYNKTYDMIEKKRILQKNNQNLATQRDLLLPRLMSGKLEV